jgi:hypothetical protein
MILLSSINPIAVTVIFYVYLKEAEEQGGGSKGERWRTILYSTPTRKFPLHPATFPPASSARPYIYLCRHPALTLLLSATLRLCVKQIYIATSPVTQAVTSFCC